MEGDTRDLASYEDNEALRDDECSELSEYSATECPLGCPAEIVVEGQQMQSVCVRFIAPHPPRTQSRDRIRSSSVSSDSPSSVQFVGHRVRSARSDKRRDRARTGGRISSRADDRLPYSHEVSCSTPDLTDAGSTGGGNESSGKQGNSTPTTSRDLDRKFQSDIENGISYFQRRCEELAGSNEVLVLELSRLREKLEEYELKISTLESDNAELKIQLDKLLTEKAEWHEQGVGEWQKRVKTEEDLVSLRAGMEKEILHLKQELRKTALEFQTARSTTHVTPASQSEDSKILRERLRHSNEIIRNLKEENERLLAERLNNTFPNAVHKIRESSKFRSPRTPRFGANQSLGADQRLVSTLVGDTISKGGQDTSVRLHLRNASDMRENKMPTLAIKALPPINVKEASLSRRQLPS